MMNGFRVCAVLVLLTLSGTSAKAALVISGESMFFSGAGSYTLDIFATAVDMDEQVSGYNIDLDFSNPNLTFTSVAYNPVFDFPTPVMAGDDPAQLQASVIFGAPLTIGIDQTVSLASITFNATAAGAIPIIPVEVADEDFVAISAVSLDQRAPSLSVTAVPEPASAFALAAIGLTSIWIRHRRRSSQKQRR